MPPMSETYESLRDNATGEGAEAWRAADREEARLRALYLELKPQVGPQARGLG